VDNPACRIEQREDYWKRRGKSWRGPKKHGAEEKHGAEAIWWAQMMQKYHFSIHYFQRLTLPKLDLGVVVSMLEQLGKTGRGPVFISCSGWYACIVFNAPACTFSTLSKPR
jgi:hypothetical protein